jgi:ATP-binding cassette subfamily B protein
VTAAFRRYEEGGGGLGGRHRQPPPPGKPLTRGLARRIFKLFRPYRGRLMVVLILIVISAALGMVSPFLLRDILDVAIPENRDELLFGLVAGMIGISVATGVLGVGQTWLTNVVGQRVMHDLRTQVYQHLQRLSLAFFTRTRTGEIQSRIANDIGGVQSVVTSTAASIVGNVTTVIASVVAMFLLDWRLAIFSLALLPFFVLLARRVGNQRRKITSVKQGAMADISSLIQESLSVSGILLGKTMGRGAELAQRFERESENLADLEVRSRMAGRWMMAAIQTSFAVMPALVYLFAGLAPGAASIGTIVAFTTLQTRLFFPVQSLLSVGVDIQTSTALFDRVFEYLDLAVDIEPGTRTLGDVRGEVHFDGVWFRYGDEWTLRDIDITVAPGTRTALVGETGAGKTSLGYLAARLYDPEQGAVRIDGTDLRELTFDALADAVGVVSQETYLFHASVRENLRFARPEATDAEIEEAARAAQIHDTIASLPEGYETVVGERGFRFSGGEKQRIAIARTVLRNPPVLVLDEATSALDVATERAVGVALERLAEGRTTLVIAHRLSTVRDADQIVVLDRGEVAERGTHEELLALGGRYAALVARDEGSAVAS